MTINILTSDANANTKNNQSKDEEDDRPVFEKNEEIVKLTRKEIDLVLANSGPTLDTFLQWGHLRQESDSTAFCSENKLAKNYVENDKDEEFI